MKNIKPFGPSIGISKISKKFINKFNDVFEIQTKKLKDYSSK